MRSDKYLWKICMEIYQQMYEEAEPSLDFRNALDNGLCGIPNWFMKYYLPLERQREIVNSVVKKYKCTRSEREAIEMEIWLGSSPNSTESC